MTAVATKTRGRVLLLACSWLGLAAALGGVLWLSLLEPRGPIQTLPDGSSIELTDVTYGKRHEHWDGNWWQRMFPPGSHPPLPFTRSSGAGRILHSPYHEFDTSSNALVLWLDTQYTGGVQSGTAATVDDHGCALQCGYEAWTGLPPGPVVDWPFLARTGIRPLELGVYPRRAVRFRYVYTSQQDAGRAEFWIRNPSPSQPREWIGAACPMTAEAGGTQFVLRRLTDASKGAPASRATAAFQYLEGGRANNSWRPQRITVSDVTGNVLETRYLDPTEHHEATFDTLCRFEPAWKVRVRFCRVEPTAVTPSFTLKLRGVPAPGWNHYAEPIRTVKHGNVSLRLVHVVGGGQIKWRNGGETTYDAPEIGLTAKAPPGEFLISLVECTDQSGRKVGIHSWPLGQVIEWPDEQITFSLVRYSAATRKLNFTFAVHRTRTVEFLVKPASPPPGVR